MTDENLGIFNSTKPVVMSFPNLIEARKFKRNGKETGEAKFDASFNFPPDHPDLKTLKEIAVSVAKAKWPGRDLGADVKSGELKLPWDTGDRLIAKRQAKLQKAGKPADEKGDFMKGLVVLKSSSKYEPRLALAENGKVVDLEGAARAASKAKFYFGVEVLIQVNFVAYDAVGDGGKDGVTAYLNMVLSTNKGKKLAGGASAAETFKGYVGTTTTEDPTGGLDDEIPF